ncbi:hypothetical protein PFISCL1PPCAC_391, partial [Pristionchus fissidentatus]
KTGQLAHFCSGMIFKFILLLALANSAVVLAEKAECNRTSVNVKRCEDPLCPIVESDRISCPGGTILRGTTGVMNATTCDAVTGTYKNVIGDIYCENYVPCVPSSVKVSCGENNLCPNVTADEISCPEGYFLMGTTELMSKAPCDTTTGLYKEMEGEITCEAHDNGDQEDEKIVNKENDELSTGTLVIIVVGVSLAVLAILAVVLCLMNRRKNGAAKRQGGQATAMKDEAKSKHEMASSSSGSASNKED